MDIILNNGVCPNEENGAWPIRASINADARISKEYCIPECQHTSRTICNLTTYIIIRVSTTWTIVCANVTVQNYSNTGTARMVLQDS